MKRIVLLISMLVMTQVFSQQVIKDLTVNKFKVVNTKMGSSPCPLMSELDRDAIASPTDGQCIYNTTSKKLNIYNDLALVWKAAGGGVDAWATGFAYSADDLVIESDKIYKALTAHTSGVFATDFASGDWVEISAGLLGPATSTDNAIARYDSTTGKLVQDSLATVSDTGVVSADDYGFNNVKYGGTLVGKSLAELNSTGLLSGAVTAINANPALFNFGAGSGEVIDYATDPANPTITPVTWSAFTGVTVTNIATADKTYVLVNPNGTLHQQITFPTQAERRAKIFAAVVVHPNHSTIQNITTLPDFTQGIGSQVYDFLDALGAFNVSGNAISANGANLSLNKTAGQIFRRSTNYANDDQNPHVTSQASGTPKAFVKATFNAQIGGSVTVIDPANYDVAGTVTAVPGGGAVSTIQRIYMFSSGLMFVQYGQTTYTNLANAIAGIQSDSFVVNPSIADGGVLLAYIAVQKNCLLLNTSCARILPAARFDAGAFGGAISVTTLQGAYNNSTAPQIITDSTRGSLDIQRGSAADTDSVLKIQNGAGLAVVDIKGNGEIKIENKITSDTVARDNNLLVNPSFEYATFNQGWTCSLGTATVEAASVTDGVKALGVVSIGAGVRCYQTSTTNVAGLKGTLIQARARVKTTDTIMKVCGLVDGNGAANERNCVDVSPTTTDNVFYSAQTQPFQAGGTSNGIVIYTTTTTVQPTVIDAAHVGVVNSSLASFSNNTSSINAGAMTIGATTTPPTKGTVSTDRIFYTRNANRLIADYQYYQTAGGVVGSGDYLFSLPIINGVQLSFGSSVVPYTGDIGSASGISSAGGMSALVGTGHVGISGSDRGPCFLFAYNATQFRANCQNTFTAYRLHGSALFSLSGAVGFTHHIDAPIAGWEANTNAAIAGCVDAVSCKEDLVATVSTTGIVSGENVDWINGNFTFDSAGKSSGNFVSKLSAVAMICSITPIGTPTTGIGVSIFSISTSGITVYTTDNSTYTTFAYNIRCSKTGIDSKPKTVVVSPLQGYVKVPGAENLNVVRRQARLNCTASSSVISQGFGSNWLTSVGNISSGSCAVTVPSGIFSLTPICQITENQTTAFTTAWKVVENSTTSITVFCSAGGAGCSGGGPINFACDGVAP